MGSLLYFIVCTFCMKLITVLAAHGQCFRGKPMLFVLNN